MREEIVAITAGKLASFYGVECPIDNDLPIEIYRDEDGLHVSELDDEEWAPTSESQLKELLSYASSQNTDTAHTLTAAEAASILGVKPGAIRQMVSRGILHPIQRAGRNFFRPEDVEAAKDRPKPGKPAKLAPNYFDYQFLARWNTGEYVEDQVKYFHLRSEAQAFQTAFRKRSPNGYCSIQSRSEVLQEEKERKEEQERFERDLQET